MQTGFTAGHQLPLAVDPRAVGGSEGQEKGERAHPLGSSKRPHWEVPIPFLFLFPTLPLGHLQLQRKYHLTLLLFGQHNQIKSTYPVPILCFSFTLTCVPYEIHSSQSKQRKETHQFVAYCNSAQMKGSVDRIIKPLF